MKTMHKLIKKFKKMHPEYDAWFDEEMSYKHYYWVSITEPVLGLTSQHLFESCREFNEWIEGVVLE